MLKQTILISLAIYGLNASVAAATTLNTTSPSNVAATRAYVHASNALSRAVQSDRHSSEVALHQLTTDVASSCRNVLLDAPKTQATDAFDEEILAVVMLTYGKSERDAIITFARATSHLHWTNPHIATDIHSFLQQRTRLTELAIPNICTDAKAWAQAHYSALPPSTVSFDKAYNLATPIESSNGAQTFSQMLKPYESDDERASVHRQSLSERASAEVLRKIVLATIAGITQSLGLEGNNALA